MPSLASLITTLSDRMAAKVGSAYAGVRTAMEAGLLDAVATGIRATVHTDTRAPNNADDSADGYAPGDRWTDTTAHHEYVCMSDTPGAPGWTQIDGGGGGGAVDSVNGQTGVVVLTASDVSAVPTTRTVNGHALSSNVTVTASDVGADATGTASAAVATHVGLADPHTQYALESALSAVATSGAYADLTGAPPLGTIAALSKTSTGDITGDWPTCTVARLAGTTPSAYGLTLIDDVNAAAARTTLGLGGAAVLAVGTSAGTVAAGDDSRIVGAVQTSRNVNTTAPLGGGGALSADLTLTIGAASGAASGSMSINDYNKLANLTNSAFSAVFSSTDANPHTCGAFAVPDLSTVVITATVAGHRDDHTQGAGYVIVGTFRRSGATVTQIGATSVLASHEDNAAWDCVFDINSTSVRIRVTGAAATNVSWRTCATVTIVP